MLTIQKGTTLHQVLIILMKHGMTPAEAGKAALELVEKFDKTVVCEPVKLDEVDPRD